MKVPYLKLYMNWENALGYSSSLSFFIMNHYEAIAGMILSMVMVISSIAVHWYKIQAIQNEEQRKQERHDQEMKQDQEVHEHNMKSNATKN